MIYSNLYHLLKSHADNDRSVVKNGENLVILVGNIEKVYEILSE